MSYRIEDGVYLVIERIDSRVGGAGVRDGSLGIDLRISPVSRPISNETRNLSLTAHVSADP